MESSEERFHRRLNDAIRRLSSCRFVGAETDVNLPVTHPSGAHAQIRIFLNGERCILSDLQQGMIEAEMVGASGAFIKLAKDIAKDFGIKFDGSSFILRDISINQLEAGLSCIANASAQASHKAVWKCAESKVAANDDQIFERVVRIFGEAKVARNRIIQGSHSEWDVSNVISMEDHLAVFEFMTPHASSVSSKFLKFSDLKLGSQGMALNAVVTDLRSLDQKAQLVADVANIVETQATDADFKRFAFAA